jgi:hypothetical protein
VVFEAAKLPADASGPGIREAADLASILLSPVPAT